MATLNLSNYKNSSGKTSVLGYSTGLAGNKDTGYSLVAPSVLSDPSIKKVAEVGANGVVTLYTNASFTDTNVTTLKGDDTEGWSIVGSEYNATVTSITTGKKDDKVQMEAMNDGAQISTGDGNDIVSVVAAAGSLNVNAGAGNDRVEVGEANGALTIALGEGTNTASVASAKSTMDISGGKGADVVEVTQVDGNATIRLGDGANQVSVGTAKANLTVSTGSGNDSVSLGAVTGNADINVGNGTNFVSLTSVDGTLTVNGGSGVDSVYVETKVSGNATITLGDGNDSVQLGAVEGDAKVDVGNGNDTVVIGGKVDKSLTVNLGDGTDELTVGQVDGNVVVNGAAGAQTVTLGQAVGGDATIALGAGKDSVEVNGNVEGKLSITTSGTDANVVAINGNKYEGGVAITMGSGADSISIVSATVGGTISLGDGKDSLFVAGLNTATVTSGAGDKVASIGAAEAASITFGAGKDSLVIAGVKSSTIDLGDGKDTVSLGAGFEESTLSLGAEDDIVSLAGNTTSGTINLGAGNDTISVGAYALGEITIAGGAGKDSINLAAAQSGTATLTDFEVGVDTLYTGAGVGGFDANMFTSDGMVSVGGAKAAVTGNGNYAVTTEFGNVAWAGETGTLMNASAFTSKAILIGTDNEDAADTILGGSKDDSIFAGANDVVYGGAGNDSIVVSSSSDAVYVGIANGAGKDSVSGFRNGTDVVYLFENSLTDISKVEVTTAGTVMKLGTSTLTLEGTGKTDVIVRDKSGVDRKVVLATSGNPVTIDRDLDKMADVYYSTDKTGTSLDFNNVDDALVVDLGNTGLLTNTHSAIYSGKFSTVKGGKDTTVLFGAAGNSETLEAGTGNTTLWGGGSASDSLTHTSGSNTVTFYYGSGDGKDTITSSNWGGSDENDVLWFGSSNLSSIKNDGTNTTVTFTSTGDKLTLAGVTDASTVVKFTTDGKTISKAKFGQAGTSNTYTYAEDVAFYMGGTKNTLSVGSDVDTANIWLDGRDGKTYDNIAAVDASSNSGDVVIAGLGNVNETITASRGTSLIWGGEGTSNDTLVGTSGGTATYFWGNGNGSDVITDSHSDDVVNLYNVALSDVAKIDTTTTSMKWTLNDGSTLTINNMSSSSVKNFQLTDSSWEYDSSTQQWNRLS